MRIEFTFFRVFLIGMSIMYEHIKAVDVTMKDQLSTASLVAFVDVG